MRAETAHTIWMCRTRVRLRTRLERARTLIKRKPLARLSDVRARFAVQVHRTTYVSQTHANANFSIELRIHQTDAKSRESACACARHGHGPGKSVSMRVHAIWCRVSLTMNRQSICYRRSRRKTSINTIKHIYYSTSHVPYV